MFTVINGLINPCCYQFYFKKNKHVFAYSALPEYWHGAGCWNHPLWKTRSQVSCIVNTIVVDIGNHGNDLVQVLAPDRTTGSCVYHHFLDFCSKQIYNDLNLQSYNQDLECWIHESILFYFSGWRLRKRYFLIKDKTQPKEKFLLSWVSLVRPSDLTTSIISWINQSWRSCYLILDWFVA